MSAFQTFAPVSQGLPGTAPQIFIGSTVDNLATITTAGYLNDLGDKVKANDVVYVNYSDTSTSPTVITAILGGFVVTVAGGNTSLSALPPTAGTASFSTFDVTVGQAALASGGSVTLLSSSGTQRYKVRSLQLNSGGTNFSGASGDRLGQVTDGTTVYSVIPAATMQSLVNAQWGVTALPNPASAAINTSTAAGSNLVFKYSGGTLDYSAGSLVISGIVQRVA